jgi:hypothetical protein
MTNEPQTDDTTGTSDGSDGSPCPACGRPWCPQDTRQPH